MSIKEMSEGATFPLRSFTIPGLRRTGNPKYPVIGIGLGFLVIVLVIRSKLCNSEQPAQGSIGQISRYHYVIDGFSGKVCSLRFLHYEAVPNLFSGCPWFNA